jgi:hypothetical protein
VSSPQPKEMERSPVNFVGKIAGRLYSIGYIIPAVLLCATKLRPDNLADQTAAKLCYWLEFIWPGTSGNFAKIIDLGYQTEASSYVILVFGTAIYTIAVLILVTIEYFRRQDKIPDFAARDAIVCWLFGVGYLFGPRLYQVSPQFTGLGSFYIDQYGFWIFKNYIMLFALVTTPAFYAVCFIKLIQMGARAAWASFARRSIH